MNGLSAISGLVEAMERRVRGEGAPFLGICVGMQLLADAGEEHGRHAGLGWVGGTVRPFDPAPGLRTPHMGWNDDLPACAHPVFVRGEASYPPGYHVAGASPVEASTQNGRPSTAATRPAHIVGDHLPPR